MSELSELFERDPLSLTKDDPAIEEAVKAFREMRYKFNLGDTRAGSIKAPKTGPKGLAELLTEPLELKI